MVVSTMNVSERRQQPPRVGVSTVIFALHPLAGQDAADVPADRDGLELWVPLVRRTRAPFAGAWALPGGVLEWNRSLDETARSTLLTATGLSPKHLEQLYSFGGTDRSGSDLRQVTIAYWAMLGLDQRSGAPVENLRWFPVGELPELAFDHADILGVAVDRLRAKTGYADLALEFLGDEFTLAELRQVHDAVLGSRSDPANFRRRMLASALLEETGSVRRDGAHRPARCYRFVRAAALGAPTLDLTERRRA